MSSTKTQHLIVISRSIYQEEFLRHLSRLNLSFVLSAILHIAVATVFAIIPNQNLTPTHRSVVELIETKEDSHQVLVSANDSSKAEEASDQTDFLSEKNNQVDRETQASKFGHFDNSGGHGGEADRPKLSLKTESLSSQASETNAGDIIVSDENETRSLSHFSPELNFQHEFINDSSPRSATEEMLKNIDIGDRTALNSREFLYYSYFDRIKARLRGYFEPAMMAKLRLAQRLKRFENRSLAPQRRPAGIEEKVTKTIITLDKNGVVIRIQILSSSGFKDLDETAVEAFQKASEFPHPPKGLIDDDGLIRIYWDFILEA